MPQYSMRRPLAPDEKNALAGHSDLLAHLLFHRGVTTAAEADAFLAPDYETGVHDPFLMKDAERAAKRIIHAIEHDERIAVFSDYDCDGIPGAAMFHDLFTRIGYANFRIYIPHRHNEGFGLNEGAIDELAADGAKVLITVDCGISDAEAVAYANAKGMEVIVTDHHEPPAELPPAYAVLDPKQRECAYPDKDLCGTGVGWKLIQAILKTNRFGLKEGHEKWLLDLVGIATLSDMVPLVGENRIYASYGLQVLRKSPRKGLRRLLEKLRISQPHLTEDDIAFMVTPRINAASRMGVPMDAFDLLTAATDEEADLRADHLDHVNDERKGVVAALVKEVKKLVRERHPERVPSVIVLGNPEWRPSLLGLAANSCAEEFRRPVFLWGRDGEGMLKGSCRSEGVSNVVELMRAVPAGVFTEFGGHKHSGGFTVGHDAVYHLEERLNEGASLLSGAVGAGEGAGVSPDQDDMIDCELSLDEVGIPLFESVNRLAPFGVGNRKPVFLFRGVSLADVRIFGKGSEHVELGFKNSRGGRIPAISFFGAASDWAREAKPGRPLDLVASIERSMFRNRPELRLRIADVIYT